MADCIFCRIAAGAIPAHLVHRSEGVIAFLDVNPSARGHTLVVPTVHAPTLLELPDGAIGDLFRAVREVNRKLDAALHPRAFHIGWNHGAAAGQHVFHLHVHVLPQFAERGRPVQALGEGAAPGDLAALAATILSA
jgi:histidine triad (HIT) family protein